MSSTSRAWTAAASIAAVEALKDQGFCRWNYTLRSVHHYAKNRVSPIAQSKNLSFPSSAVVSRKLREAKSNQSEESLRKVMYLSCWGPY
uniref:Wound-responsive family protein n=1 Tax=Rhizophora mucronata TaxID=61149 RepID=A0A2P2M6U0_RHIMU